MNDTCVFEYSENDLDKLDQKYIYFWLKIVHIFTNIIEESLSVSLI